MRLHGITEIRNITWTAVFYYMLSRPSEPYSLLIAWYSTMRRPPPAHLCLCLLSDMDSLNEKHCVPCRGGMPPLERDAADKLLSQLDGWEIAEKGTRRPRLTLRKRFSFDDFRQSMEFLGEVADLAESEGHHPDFSVHYNRVTFTIWTHAIGGLHENDFILASKIDRRFESIESG
jgi:4a-hydroxytetrahydrobiopterin dehydratase